MQTIRLNIEHSISQIPVASNILALYVHVLIDIFQLYELIKSVALLTILSTKMMKKQCSRKCFEEFILQMIN